MSQKENKPPSEVYEKPEGMSLADWVQLLLEEGETLMSEEKEEHRVVSHLSNKELAERISTPDTEWIVKPADMSTEDFLQQMADEVIEEGIKRKKQDNG